MMINSAFAHTWVSEKLSHRVGESTFNVPGTNNGKLACVWVINTAIEEVYGKPITTGKAGLDVKETLLVIQAEPERYQPVTQEEALSSGQDYIIVTKTGMTPGHGSHIGIGNKDIIYENDSYIKQIITGNTYTWMYYYKAASYYLIK